MKLNTTSETISFALSLEEKSSEFYKALSLKYPAKAEVFQSFIRENQKYITQIQRAYYGVISDALEGGFAFNLEKDDYIIRGVMVDDLKPIDSLNEAIDMEEIILRFYKVAADQSKSLMADVPRAFSLVAKKREKRVEILKALVLF